MATVEIGNVHLYYEVLGKGPPLVLLTGLSGSSDFYWKTILPNLVKDFQVIMLDNRGSGKTTSSESVLTIDMMADDTMNLIRHLGLKQPHICGHSMGSAIALSMAQRYNDEIGQLVLVNSFPKLTKRSTLFFQMLDNLLYKEIPPSEILSLAIPWNFSEKYLESDKSVKELLAFWRGRTIDCERFSRQLKALFAFDATPWLHTISTDTLIIASESDVIAPPDQSEQISEAIPESRLAIIEGGHSSLIENPNDLVTLIIDFLS
jgi:pimeloyl-ACP methyl ester carboxylesterase